MRATVSEVDKLMNAKLKSQIRQEKRLIDRWVMDRLNKKHRNGQTDRQIDRQTDRQTDRHIYFDYDKKNIINNNIYL